MNKCFHCGKKERKLFSTECELCLECYINYLNDNLEVGEGN